MHCSKFIALSLLLLCTSCNSSILVAPQAPKTKPAKPTYQRIGVFFPKQSIPQRLTTSIDGDPLRIGRVDIVIGKAIEETILNTLKVSAETVRVFNSPINFRDIQRMDLDAFFWLETMSGISALEREGTLWPSYTSYSSISMKLMRMSGFRGTLDSIQLTGRGDHYAHRTGASRAYIARTSAEIALRDLADRLARLLNPGANLR